MEKVFFLVIVVAVMSFAVLGWSIFTPVGAFKGAPSSFDFTLSVNPTSGIVIQGQSTTSTVKATLLKGKTQNVQLSAVNCPASISCTFNPGSGYPTFSSMLSIVTSTDTSQGSYPITIIGSGGGKTKTTTYTLIVNPSKCQILLNLVESKLGTICGDTNYDKVADVNKDGTINVFDILLVKSNFGNEAWCQQMLNDPTDPCYIPCNCSGWINGACGAGGCNSTSKLQTRTCTPSGCDITSRCVYNSTCTTPDSCSDTDGGFITTVRGTVSGYKSGYPYNYTDVCLTTNNMTLIEYYCSGTSALNSTFNCWANTTTFCSNGVCV